MTSQPLIEIPVIEVAGGEDYTAHRPRPRVISLGPVPIVNRMKR
jgi:hypothetical protein